MNPTTPPRRDLTGQKFGRLTVTGKWERKKKHIVWQVVCECGITKWAQDSGLLSGTTQSCGCLRKERQEKQRQETAAKKLLAETIRPQEDEEYEEEKLEVKQSLTWHEQQRQKLWGRFQLVRTVSRHGVFYGVYDTETHRQELISPDKREALAHIERLVDERALPPMEYGQRFAPA